MIKRTIIIIIFSLGLSWNCYAQHSNEEYVNNPKLIITDAKLNQEQGNIEQAIRLYKLYSGLTGEDTSSEIAKIKKQSYPNWYNSSTMKAMTMNDGKFLIIFDSLQSMSIWDSDNIEEITIPNVPGTWETCATESVYRTLLSHDVPIPSEGLFGGRKGGDIVMKWEADTPKGTVAWNDVKTTYVVILWRDHSEVTSDCGTYSKTGNPTRNGTVEFEIKDNRKPMIVRFYPFRVFKESDGAWIEVKQERMINTSTTTR